MLINYKLQWNNKLLPVFAVINSRFKIQCRGVLQPPFNFKIQYLSPFGGGRGRFKDSRFKDSRFKDSKLYIGRKFINIKIKEQ